MKKLLFLCLLFVGASLSSAEPYLFQDGKALWKITFRTSDDESEPTVKLASRELNSLLLRISDADIPDEKASSKDQVKICFGVEEKLKREEVNIYWDGQILHFTAGAPQSLISAVYYFVQKEMGVRWLWPGEDGEFIPKKTSYSIRKDLKLHHLPAFRYRGMHTCGDWYKIHEFRTWMAHNYVNVHRHGTNFKNDLRFIKMLSTHNVYLEKSYFKTHPEYFAEIGGKRHTTQVCLNNHDVADILYERFAETLRKHPEIEILSIFPSDNQDYCQCEKCREKGVSTSWFDFFNEMAERLKKDFPYIKLSTIAYQGYISVPKNPVRNAEFVEYASYPRCNIHRYGDPRCTINVSVQKAQQDWAATGVVMGNYAYEFDMFSGAHQPFTPFYSMIEDTVRTAVKLKQISLIPEVSLSPRNGPDEEVSSCQNRLAEYIYAQMMWDPQQNAYDLIREWCDLAYGKAAKPMYEYFTMLDKQWDSMDLHFKILGRALNVAPCLITPEIRKKAETLLQEADKLLDGKMNPALEFEKKLFRQWLAFLNDPDTLAIPKFEKADAAASSNVRFPIGGENAPSVAWTRKALIVNHQQPPFILSLSAGFGGETWFFHVGHDGMIKTWRRSSVGVDDVKWSPKWVWQDGMAGIPFDSLTDTPPEDNSKWLIRLTQNRKTWPENDFATLQFCGTSDIGRSVLWWTGSIDRDAKQHASIKKAFDDIGWKIRIAEQGALIRELPAADIYAFRNPSNKPNPLSKDDYEFLREKIRNGATGFFASYSGFALEKIFADPSYKVSVNGIRNTLLGQRRTRTLYPGAWTENPHKIKNAQMRGYTPAYFLVPAQPEQWRILATLPESGETNAAERPYLMARPFGKGIVIVLALDPWFSIPCTISNIIMNRDEIFKPDDAVQEKAVSENEKGKQTIQTDADQKKRKTNSDRKKQTEKITENERSFDEKTIESHGI